MRIIASSMRECPGVAAWAQDSSSEIYDVLNQRLSDFYVPRVYVPEHAREGTKVHTVEFDSSKRRYFGKVLEEETVLLGTRLRYFEGIPEPYVSIDEAEILHAFVRIVYFGPERRMGERLAHEQYAVGRSTMQGHAFGIFFNVVAGDHAYETDKAASFHERDAFLAFLARR